VIIYVSPWKASYANYFMQIPIKSECVSIHTNRNNPTGALFTSLHKRDYVVWLTEIVNDLGEIEITFAHGAVSH
jgi:hypothetical protein